MNTYSQFLKFKYRGKDYEISPISKTKFLIFGWRHPKVDDKDWYQFTGFPWVIVCEYSSKYNVWFEEYVNMGYMESLMEAIQLNIAYMNEIYSEAQGLVIDNAKGVAKKAVREYLKYLQKRDE